MAVPYTFGTATAAIPLSNLDSNFATPITLGNTAIQLGNTVTTLNNMTLANVTVSSGSVTLTNIAVTTANVTTANIGTAVITTANVTTANISGTTTLTNLTASTALALDASKNIVSVTNTGSGNNVLGTSPTIATPTINTITSAAGTALVLQSNNGNTAVTYDTSQNATFVGYANLPNTFGFKNRIINGAMVIDQRNAGATVSSSGAFPVDRFIVIKDTSAGTFTAGQSSTVPSSGFTKSLLFTVGTAYTPAAGENNFLKHYIEGYNIADLSFGTAGASNITLSFWVRSSLTGTFGGALTNGGNDRTYVFSYTISAANTFEYKTISIPAYTSGTWNTTNSVGFEIRWGLGVGSTFLNTAGAWYTGNYVSATGSTNITSTAGATWYVTGVQLEKGSTATSFDVRSYGTEFALCQRYYQQIFGTSGLALFGRNNAAAAGQGPAVNIFYKTSMRAAPTGTVVGTWTKTNTSGGGNPGFNNIGTEVASLYVDSAGSGDCFYYAGSSSVGVTMSAEL